MGGLQSRLDEFKKQFESGATHEVIERMRCATAELEASGLGKKALKVGNRAPRILVSFLVRQERCCVASHGRNRKPSPTHRCRNIALAHAGYGSEPRMKTRGAHPQKNGFAYVPIEHVCSKGDAGPTSFALCMSNRVSAQLIDAEWIFCATGQEKRTAACREDREIQRCLDPQSSSHSTSK